MSVRAKEGATVWLALLVGIAGLAGMLALQDNLDRVTAIDPGQELLYLPDKMLIHILSLGDDATGADILWLRGVFYIAANDVEEKQTEYYSTLDTRSKAFQEERQASSFVDKDFRDDPIMQTMFFWNLNSKDAPQLKTLVDRVTDLDPAFVTPYVYGAVNLAMYYGRIDEAMDVINKGVANCPKSWEVFYHRGFLKLFFGNDKIGATEDLHQAAILPGAPIIVVQLAAALEVGTGNKETALDFLRSLREVTNDETLRQKIDEMLKAYGNKIVVEKNEDSHKVGNMLDSLLSGISTK